MDVRSLLPAHRELAVELWVNAELTRPWNDPSADFDRALSSSRSAVLGMFVDDVLVATVMVGDDGHRGWVYYLAVNQTHRRQGLGRCMMDAAEQWLSERGVAKMNVMVRNSNPTALGFYERLGYEDDDVTVVSRRFDAATQGVPQPRGPALTTLALSRRLGAALRAMWDHQVRRTG